jgi:tripartite-type tricarboxylate transporter receptor subunit TctC
VKNIDELIAKAKADPGKLVFGSGGPGSSNQLATELFATMAGIKMTHVPYRGDTPAITDLLGGQIDLIFLNIPAALPILSSGKVHAIGITGKTRSPLMPDVPTIAETVPGYEAGSWQRLLRAGRHAGPRGRDVEHRIAPRDQHAAGARQAEGRRRQRRRQHAREFTAFVKTEIDKWAQIIRTANVKL